MARFSRPLQTSVSSRFLESFHASQSPPGDRWYEHLCRLRCRAFGWKNLSTQSEISVPALSMQLTVPGDLSVTSVSVVLVTEVPTWLARQLNVFQAVLTELANNNDWC